MPQDNKSASVVYLRHSTFPGNTLGKWPNWMGTSERGLLEWSAAGPWTRAKPPDGVQIGSLIDWPQARRLELRTAADQRHPYLVDYCMSRRRAR